MIYYNLLRPLFPVCKSPSALPNREIREPPPAIGFRQYAVVFLFGRLTFSKNAPMNHEIARKNNANCAKYNQRAIFVKKATFLKVRRYESTKSLTRAVFSESFILWQRLSSPSNRLV